MVATVATAPVLLTATAAYADPGTIKVHAQGTPFEDNANNPKPGCQFYIAAFGVTAGETYRVTFTPQPENGNGPAGDPTTASDTDRPEWHPIEKTSRAPSGIASEKSEASSPPPSALSNSV